MVVTVMYRLLQHTKDEQVGAEITFFTRIRDVLLSNLGRDTG
jgi:hypothetical protein